MRSPVRCACGGYLLQFVAEGAGVGDGAHHRVRLDEAGQHTEVFELYQHTRTTSAHTAATRLLDNTRRVYARSTDHQFTCSVLSYRRKLDCVMHQIITEMYIAQGFFF